MTASMIELGASKLKSCDASKVLRKLHRVQGLGGSVSGIGVCFTFPVNAFSRNLGGSGGKESSRRQVMRPPDIRCTLAQDENGPASGINNTGVPGS